MTGPPLAVAPARGRAGTNALGSYLRARREQVTPREAGLPDGGVRRVPGLRREEVALLAGISADYYLRLERGRDRNPSPQVLDALARVLRLDEAHTAYLRTLVEDAPRAARPRAGTPPAGALKLLATLPQPAFIEDRYFDVLASNDLARALSPRLAAGGNQLRDLFLDPAEQALFPDWRDYTECLVANLRQSVGNDLDDPRLAALVDELSQASPLFRRLWARHEVRGQWGSPVRLAHPRAGDLVLNRERFDINGADGQMLVVLHPDAGSADAERLAILGN
ncbi:helix-turn-helix domain-containing protein [Promicromonospora sp. MS192]|uniref:helix-turn-helix domain-containing protein n=1 Tax=Promicromonospora sp. MS192 TaxID=3412684 RepID=UPI003C2AE531